MIVRLITNHEQFRIKTESTATLHNIIVSNIGECLYKATFEENIIDSKLTLNDLNIKHGAVINVEYEKEIVKLERKPQEVNTCTKHEPTAMCPDCAPISKPTLERNTSLCSHGPNAMCANCVPMNSWDFDYHEKSGIKYLSFESYKNLLKSEKCELKSLTYKRKDCGSKHEKGVICMECMDKGITITQQVYRMIDHVELHTKSVVEDFVMKNKQSRKQYFGLLIGKRESYDRSPGGVKAVVKTIFMPKQENFMDGFTLEDDIVNEIASEDKISTKNGTDKENIKKIESADIKLIKDTGNQKLKETEGNDSILALKFILSELGLEIVGVLYTKLFIEKTDSLINASEVLFMANLQNMLPYVDLQYKQIFNSQCVTLVLTENDNEIEIRELMVSEQAMTLIKENIITLCEDIDAFKSTHKLVYKTKNEYKIATRSEQNYVPSDYFVISLTHGYKTGEEMFNEKIFEWCWSLKKAISNYFSKDEICFDSFKNLNVLVWIMINKMLSLSLMADLLKAIRMNNSELFGSLMITSEFLSFIAKLRSVSNDWTCNECTYINLGSKLNCDMCEMPKIE